MQCGGTPPPKTEPSHSAGAHWGCVDAMSLLSAWLHNSYGAVSDLQAHGEWGTAPEQIHLGSNLPAVCPWPRGGPSAVTGQRRAHEEGREVAGVRQ